MPRTSTNVSERTCAVHPIAKVVAIAEKRQTMNRKMNMKTRVMPVINIFEKDRQQASTANIKYTLRLNKVGKFQELIIVPPSIKHLRVI